MNVTEKQPGDHSLAYVDEDPDESFIGLDNGPGDCKQMGQSVVILPSSVQEYLEGSLKPSGTVNIPLKDRVVKIKKVFAADMERADEPQNFSLNGVKQKQVEKEDDLVDLVERIDDLVGHDRVEAATEIASQRPGIALRNAIREEFQSQFRYDPIFDAQGVMDSSVDLRADANRIESETRLTGLIRMVMPTDGSLEPLALESPILYDATAEFDVIQHTIEYRIDFQPMNVPKKKKKFCVIL